MKSKGVGLSDRNKGGWLYKKYNYMSWALSCLQFRKYYEDVELVTDSAGKNLLIDKLGLPYTKVTVCLDKLNDYHTDLWSLGKIYAYSIQDNPFIHADADVFIFDRFTKEFENAALVAQNFEKGFAFYDDVFKSAQANFDFVPPSLARSKERHNQIWAANAGVIGGNSVEFFKEYTSLAFQFVDENISKLSNIDIGMFNIIFEQFLFYALAEDKSLEVNFLLNGINHAFDGLADFTSVPAKHQYIHTVGVYKRIKYIGDSLAFRLQLDHPIYYYRILNLMKDNQI